jgi:hypothetical protein
MLAMTAAPRPAERRRREGKSCPRYQNEKSRAHRDRLFLIV